MHGRRCYFGVGNQIPIKPYSPVEGEPGLFLNWKVERQVPNNQLIVGWLWNCSRTRTSPSAVSAGRQSVHHLLVLGLHLGLSLAAPSMVLTLWFHLRHDRNQPRKYYLFFVCVIFLWVVSLCGAINSLNVWLVY